MSRPSIEKCVCAGDRRARFPVLKTFTRAEVGDLEAELSAAIARLRAGEFRPTPSEYACAGCPALDVVCAGPRLGAFSEA